MRWTAEEVEFLKNNQTPEGRRQLAEISGRTYLSVVNKAKKEGLTLCRESIDPKIVLFLQENLKNMGRAWCAEQLNLPIRRIYEIARNNSIINKTPAKWELYEDQYLKDNWNVKSVLEIARHLNRSVSSIKNRSHKLGISQDKRWTQEEDSILKEFYNKISIEELMQKLNRSRSAIMVRACESDLTDEFHTWTRDEDDWLRRFYPIKTNFHCASKLGVSESAVKNRAHFLSLQKERIEYESSDYKKCSTCKQYKCVSVFQFKKSRNSYSASCRDCLNEKTRGRIPVFSSEQKELIHGLFNDGHSASEIANITKLCGKSKMSLYLKNNGMRRTHHETREIRKNKDNIGKKFGLLTLLEPTRLDGFPAWKCICDCGNHTVIRHIYLKHTKSCGCLVKKKGAEHFAWEGFEEISGGLFARYKLGADSRNLVFDITIEQIWNLFLKQDRKCALSGLDISFDRENTTASLDRIDSEKGYTIDNIQWVHKTINRLKLDLPENKLFYLIKVIYEHQNLSNFQYNGQI